jgi:hypothetical protein
MITDNTEMAEQDLRELATGEIDEVSGGHPALILAFAVGFDLGFIGVCAFGPLD